MTTWTIRLVMGILCIAVLSTESLGRGNVSILAKTEVYLSPLEMKEAQNLFARLGYFSGSINGTHNEWVFYATLAFQRNSGLPATGRLTKSNLVMLREASSPRPKATGFFHVEVDTSHQILFVVNPDNTVTHILPIALGSMKIYRLGGKKYRARNSHWRVLNRSQNRWLAPESTRVNVLPKLHQRWICNTRQSRISKTRSNTRLHSSPSICSRTAEQRYTHRNSCISLLAPRLGLYFFAFTHRRI